MWKREVVYKTGSTYITSRFALPSEKDRATATIDMCVVKFGRTVFEICERTHKQTNRQIRWSQHFASYRGRIKSRPSLKFASPLSCRYWRVNYPFCCIHCCRDSQYFSMGRTTPIIPLPVGRFRPSSNACFFAPLSRVSLQAACLSVQPFLRGISVWPTGDTDRQTDHATCDICSNRPHLYNACDVA